MNQLLSCHAQLNSSTGTVPEVEHWTSSDQSERKSVSRNQFCTTDEFQLYAQRAGFQLLARFDDSPWIQLVAGKELELSATEEQQRRLAADRHAVAYSPLFGQLFGVTVPVIYGQRHPRELLAELQVMPQLPEVELYLGICARIVAGEYGAMG